MSDQRNPLENMKKNSFRWNMLGKRSLVKQQNDRASSFAIGALNAAPTGEAAAIDELVKWCTK